MRKGFTLIELLIVVALILIIGSMSASFYTRFVMQNDIINTVNKIASSIHKAQLYSMMGKRASSWGISLQTGKLVLFSGASYDTRQSDVDEVFPLHQNLTLTDTTEIVFEKRTGVPNTTASIMLLEGDEYRTITVNSEGIVNVQ